MATYIVFIRERTLNPSELETYSQKASAAMSGHAARRLWPPRGDRGTAGRRRGYPQVPLLWRG